MKTLITILLFSVGCLAQVAVVDDSTGPVGLASASVHKDGTGKDCTARATAFNHSGKAVAAYYVTTVTSNTSGVGRKGFITHDHLFSSDMPGISGEQFDVLLPCSVVVDGMHLRFGFVQFADGSTIGDTDAIQIMRTKRADSIAYLKSLQGASDLTTALKRPPTPSTTKEGGIAVRSMQSTLVHKLDEGGVQAASDTINSYLDAARAHAAWLR